MRTKATNFEFYSIIDGESTNSSACRFYRGRLLMSGMLKNICKKILVYVILPLALMLVPIETAFARSSQYCTGYSDADGTTLDYCCDLGMTFQHYQCCGSVVEPDGTEYSTCWCGSAGCGYL